MLCEELDTVDLLHSLRDFIDTVWEIDPETGQALIVRDEVITELENTVLSYEEVFKLYDEKYLYPKDRGQWWEEYSLESVHVFMASPKRRKKRELRIAGEPFGFVWHEVVLSKVKTKENGRDRLFLFTRDITANKRSLIVETAVRNEYDYVVYLEADTNSYIMYSANYALGTSLPPVVGINYTEEMRAYNTSYCVDEDRERMIESMQLSNILEELDRNGTYTLYCRVVENQRMAYKKLHLTYFDQARRIVLMTRTDITEIREEKRQRELLRDALNAATIANRAKSDFLARMSHDIRTPMNAIIGMTAIAGTHIHERERVLDCLKKITSSSRLLLSLINEILDMSKIESGRIVLSQEPFDLGELLQNLLIMMQPDIEAKKHTLNIHVNQLEQERVIGDSQRVQQVLMNILSNAVKYTPEHGRIIMKINQCAVTSGGIGCYEFVIEDNGIGMKPDFVEKVFEPFERADDSDIRAIQGTGLGMAISKNLAQLMGGDIQVESVYGKGSRFTATLHLQLQEQDREDESMLANLPVLVADDDPITCENTCECLDDIGMNSHGVFSGTEALEQVALAHAEGGDYFAAILDLKMPDMNGIEVTRRIRATVGRDMPIIILTAYDCAEYEMEARAAGADGFVSKPLFRSKLVHVLKKFAFKEDIEESWNIPIMPSARYDDKHILLVEDNELNREIAVEIIGSTGAQVEIAVNGQEAVDKVVLSPQGYYNLVFMDIQMPVMNGYQAAKAIRALQRDDVKGLPIIAMTANAFSEDIEAVREAGMNRHLAKPIEILQLMEVMAAWLN